MRFTPLLAGLWIAACSVEESTSIEESALHGTAVFPDSSSSEANAVVFVLVPDAAGGKPHTCSGTLITQQIVLTANHCFTGFAPAHSCRPPSTTADVIIGNLIDDIEHDNYKGCPKGICNPTYGSAAVLLRSGWDNCQADYASDVAIIYLQEAVTPASLAAKTHGGIPVPSAPRTLEPDFQSPHHAMYGVAGYQGENLRQEKEFLSNDLDHGTEDDNSYWEIKRGDWDVDHGDSGGPLFTLTNTEDGVSRNVIGVLSGWYEGAASTYVRWADLTRNGNNDFIRGNITNESVPASLRPSDAWLAAHGKTRQDWWGEVDYTGPKKAADLDGDGWIGGHDNCPMNANADQRDADGDGMGDACDPTPFGKQDSDGDGVLDAYPGAPDWYVADNCPTVKNPDQANCNLDAELAERRRFPGTEILGDACDPVPCPAISLRPGPNPPPNEEYGDKENGGWIAGRMAHNYFVINRVSPHARNGNGGYPLAVSAPDIETGARFCQKNLTLGFDCRAPVNMTDAEFEYAPSRDDELYDPAHPWHRISFDLNYDSWLWTYDNTQTVQHWTYFSDNDQWYHNGLIPPADGRYAALCMLPEVGEGTCLDGTLWYHAKTEIGRTVASVHGVPVGLHLKKDSFGSVNDPNRGANNMANSYFDVRPDEAWKVGYPGKHLYHQFLLRVPEFDPRPNEDVIRARIRPLVAEELTQPAFVIEDDGLAHDAAPQVSDWAQGFLVYPYFAWLSAAEPPGVQSRIDNRIAGVAMDIYGRTVEEAVVLDGPLLRTMQEMNDWSFHSSADETYAPGPREHWIGTFSRNLGGVFVIGGTDLWTGEQLHDIRLWRYSLGWQQIPIPGLEKPVAAVFSPVDQRLWLLDEKANGTTQLLRIDPFTNTFASAGVWANDTSVWDGHRLDLDRDGNVLLTASSSSLHASKVAALALPNAVAIARVIDRDVPYTTAMPLVDQNEYGFIEVDETGALGAIQRKAQLSGGSGPLDGMFR